MSTARFPIPQGTLDMLILQILSLEPGHQSTLGVGDRGIYRHDAGPRAERGFLPGNHARREDNDRQDQGESHQHELSNDRSAE